MRFECLTCHAIYLEIPALAGEIPRTVVGICEPCARNSLGDDRYDRAVGHAIATVERSSRREKST